MAHRPVFVPSINRPWVRRETVEFTWHPGLSVSQKQKSIASLHAAASSMLQVSAILPLEPQSLFYDWLYISALMQPHNEALLSELLRYHAFTDIEFNPEKSVSCQANSAALLLGLQRSGHELARAMNPTSFCALFSVPQESHQLVLK
jgi:hypothetical protein